MAKFESHRKFYQWEKQFWENPTGDANKHILSSLCDILADMDMNSPEVKTSWAMRRLIKILDEFP